MDATDTIDTTDTATPPVSRQVDIVRISHGQRSVQTDALAEEIAIALEFNGISYATMLATPADLEDFAIGFSLSEGVVAHPREIRGVDILPGCDGIVVQVEIATEREVAMKARRRAMAGRTGCGLCGVESLDKVIRPVGRVPSGGDVSLAQLSHALTVMRGRQSLHDTTGATHAAGFMAASGDVSLVREDVGRHNALDKLIGALARARIDTEGGAAIVSSRASYEMVQKTASAGIGVLVAVSAPTALAVRLAQDAGLVLIGFMRGEQCVVYSHTDRLKP
ncbi:formate dehydrogenase accessory sulfurtransferase FdhD [Pigmentiphaga aceris]|uniref:Sulfur carrier protein FdhD n=1 Tax=Pigmentiphaga aceris TaxID=1940612 RepID=A0A5C0B6S5_9BURK|nr:formate dehydrogenase accessory sulfurtransferase FdhD [Pigmentiphaga aceris]